MIYGTLTHNKFIIFNHHSQNIVPKSSGKAGTRSKNSRTFAAAMDFPRAGHSSESVQPTLSQYSGNSCQPRSMPALQAVVMHILALARVRWVEMPSLFRLFPPGLQKEHPRYHRSHM